jgi:hypothetical protein
VTAAKKPKRTPAKNTGRATGNPIEWRHNLLAAGPEDGTTRLVLLVVGVYMNGKGQAFPSGTVIARGACLSRRWAVEHIRRAVQTGWLLRRQNQTRTGAYRRNDYQAAYPPGFKPAPRRPKTSESAAPHPSATPFELEMQRRLEGERRLEMERELDAPYEPNDPLNLKFRSR